ncbi:GNAT family N-acetyltransferase [Xylophilus sp. GOD-11R]|uniref:GNAT family N-acetyltransferase n=1 Tax=Xylophilus sp. GOD-11R TaxID=3089814 RepID=UPI00298D0F64|nr:GNAT family N-acetyltransferase [Xylophilus sp. GOD-11R]WPB55674.1 N-acetyltransferase family protein [Xylophilus sp. GOD-11R]
MHTIRSARDTDLAAITAIYGHYVLNSTASFETEAPTVADMTARRAEVLSRGLPYLVLEDAAGGVAGYAYCNWFKPRPAYRFSAENSIYLAPTAVGGGRGRALLDALCTAATEAGVRQMIAVIGGSDNHASIRLHRAAGFGDAGFFKASGWKFGRWLDVVLMQKALGAGDGSAPE